VQRYNPKEIEPKWQKQWEKSKIYEASEDSSKPKRYVLEYFPYPSGAAMHVGHVRNYTIGDVVSRHARMSGFNVLHPMGWDAFGLPAENYALKTGISPQQAIQENTGKFKQQLTTMGFSYDWSREFASSDPLYYRWTQWFFLLLLKRGLAYRQESLQWWCPVDKTVLANEQVENGHCWRCGSEVEKKALKQWFFKITDYADRLAKDLDDVDWTDAIKSMQRNWIGRSIGAEIDFKIDGHDQSLKVFTTRADTVFGATYMVLAPEHPLLKEIVPSTHKQQVENYQQKARNKSDIERQETNREKTGVFTGAYVINPINDEKLPIWTADYVLAGYGTGAIMAVPAHDERDFAFAKAFDLPIRQVVAPEFGVKREREQFADGGASVVFDPNTQKYAFLQIEKNGNIALFAGGRKPAEELHEGILRELREESGLTHIKQYEEIGTVYGHYYHSLKEINRRASATILLVNLEDTEAIPTQLEAHEKFHPVWLDALEVLTKWQADKSGDYDHYAYALKLAVGRNIELGFDTTSDPSIFIHTAILGEGTMVNSGPYDGMSSSESREKIVADLSVKQVGQEKVNYRMRDWLISRQRYWGAPIPIIYCPKDGTVPVPEDQLPVVLPELKVFEPSGDGRSPLAGVSDFVNTTCPVCDGPAERETDTMDGFACSSWYFLRFADPHNAEKAFDTDEVKFWLPVDDYIGGAEHAVMHLLYARMWTKVMQDEGLIDFGEPFKALRNQGMILAPDGQKMSKSKGNTIQPDELIDQGYGADSIRIMEMFIGPWNQSANWSVEGMGGSFRFLQRIWNLVQEYNAAEKVAGDDERLRKVVHRAIKRVSEDLANMGFNTAIAALMELTNDLYKLKLEVPIDTEAWKESLETTVQLLAPFAPHITEELWHQLGQKDSVHVSTWPVYDSKYLVEDSVTIAVQIGGKLRGTITAPAGCDEDEAVGLAKNDSKISSYLSGKQVVKTIYVPNKLLNFVVK
jgi:leucyl-tRNA synthetase